MTDDQLLSNVMCIIGAIVKRYGPLDLTTEELTSCNGTNMIVLKTDDGVHIEIDDSNIMLPVPGIKQKWSD